MKDNAVTVGADPEIILLKDGEPVPAIGVVGGTKYAPRPLGIGAVQEDNVMAEFNIPPAHSANEFDYNIETMLATLENLVTPQGYTFSNAAWANYHPSHLEHPLAESMGCEPDWNAWTLEQNRPPNSRDMKGVRATGGHIHVGGFGDKYPEERQEAVLAMDLRVGVPLSLLVNDSVRKQFYGQAGAYRPKPYGIEYRVPNNHWIWTSAFRKWIFNQTVDAIVNKKRYALIARSNQPFILAAINQDDVGMAAKLVKNHKIPLPV